MSQSLAQDEELRQLAISYEYGILMSEGGPIIIGFEGGATGQGGDFHHADSIQIALNKLASISGVTGINNLPLITFGHSLGVFFSQGMGLWSAGQRANNQPEMVAGVISYHLGNAPLSNFGWASSTQLANFKTLPNLWMNAELEGPEANNGTNLNYFSPLGRAETFSRRQNGELVHQTILKNGNHSVYTYKDLELMSKFIKKVVEYRVPSNHNFTVGRPTLNLIDETQGHLGRSSVYNNFLDTNYTFGPYQNLNPATHWFLFDQEYAEAWKAYHLTDMLATSGFTTACIGETLSVNYDNISQKPFGANNRFLVQLSSIISNFESPGQYPKIIGSIASTAQQGTIQIVIPDNLIAPTATSNPLQPIIAGSAPGMYRIRIISTNPYQQSNNIGNIDIKPNTSNCPEPDFYLQSIRSNEGPLFNNLLCSGKDTSFLVSVIRRNATTFNAGNTINIELSDSAGNFSVPTIVGTKATLLTIVTNTSWSRDTIRVQIPTTTLPNGYNYKLRATSNQPTLISSTNGSSITIRNCNQPFLVTELAGTSVENDLVFYPNPASRYLNIASQHIDKVVLYDALGKSINLNIYNGQVDVRLIENGVYSLVAYSNGKTIRRKIIILND
jgi:hypothetical protein